MSARDDTSARALKTAGLVFISYHVACMVLLGAGVAWHVSNPLAPPLENLWGGTAVAAVSLLIGVGIGWELRGRASKTAQIAFSRFVSPEMGIMICLLRFDPRFERDFAPAIFIILGVLSVVTFLAKVYLRRKFPRATEA